MSHYGPCKLGGGLIRKCRCFLRIYKSDAWLEGIEIVVALIFANRYSRTGGIMSW